MESTLSYYHLMEKCCLLFLAHMKLKPAVYKVFVLEADKETEEWSDLHVFLVAYNYSQIQIWIPERKYMKDFDLLQTYKLYYLQSRIYVYIAQTAVSRDKSLC